MLKMHKVIMPTNNKKLEVDHIDRNKTNNMKSNLRIVDRTYNNLNQGNRKDNKSGIKGVSFYKKIGRWVTQLKIKEKRYYKQFDTFEEACEYRKYLEETYINYNNLKEKQYGKVDNI